MMNDPFSALDRHAVLSGSDDGFPWFASAMLAVEASEVVSLRLAKFAVHDEDSEREASLMVSEKILAAFEAGANWLAGGHHRPLSRACRRQREASFRELI